VKHDGFRAIAYIKKPPSDQPEELSSTDQNHVELSALLAQLPVRDAILDGELICLDGDGRSQFIALMRCRKTRPLLCVRSGLVEWC
jgi:ATP-dependent DNA ligase